MPYPVVTLVPRLNGPQPRTMTQGHRPYVEAVELGGFTENRPRLAVPLIPILVLVPIL